MKRFFSERSFWNRPIRKDAPTDERSDHCIELLEMEPTGGLHVNLRQYTIPVYEVDGGTPLRHVRQRVSRDEDGNVRTIGPAGRTFSQHPDFPTRVPIPDYAVSDPATDHHMAMVDPERRLAWDMWGAVQDEEGAWKSYTGMHYPLDGDGVWDVSEFPAENGESIHCHGPGRAAGVPIIAGLITRKEVEAGRIEHKLACATRFGAYQEFTPPAAWTDGTLAGGLPEGAVLQLDPDLDLLRFQLGPGALTVCRALQRYGMVNVDCARATTLYGEGLYYEGAPDWEGLLGERELMDIPLRHFRVLQMGEIVRMGDGRRRRTDPAQLIRN